MRRQIIGCVAASECFWAASGTGRGMRSAWIWFIGSAVWWGDAAIAVHYGNTVHAILALCVASLFLAMGMMTRKH
jgi:hypothetical protein